MVVVEETPAPVPVSLDEEWSTQIDPAVLDALPASEINRQTIIHKLITNEIQYHKDLDVIESVRFLLCIMDGMLRLTLIHNEHRCL
jgi:hypothetical protein